MVLIESVHLNWHTFVSASHNGRAFVCDAGWKCTQYNCVYRISHNCYLRFCGIAEQQKAIKWDFIPISKTFSCSFVGNGLKLLCDGWWLKTRTQCGRRHTFQANHCVIHGIADYYQLTMRLVLVRNIQRVIVSRERDFSRTHRTHRTHTQSSHLSSM